MNYNKIKNFNINNYKKSKKIKTNLTTLNFTIKYLFKNDFNI